MAKKKTASPVQQARPIPSTAVHVPPPAPTVVIALTADSISAKGARCPAGMVISPNIDGWPEHRVAAHVRDGRAAKVPVDGD